ncbi:hypothetical protein OUZ56_013871 [Daphnia magna]|uniref:Uncharacterized protein n=1 Tax=Daphnia magna TaxID=35525 RepID=A0ABQ9Z762_9CRUS|nr:hypothetical protein OUZ56_013871 [Daphnia magna]
MVRGNLSFCLKKVYKHPTNSACLLDRSDDQLIGAHHHHQDDGEGRRKLWGTSVVSSSPTEIDEEIKPRDRPHFVEDGIDLLEPDFYSER